ncbi:iron hydrogenase [Mycotypha africana]|uniref:iron hydrogenase n=1 Tax=Mycotypha africana TaxID=64632 RepID=UPI0023001FD3|nr:iron hydrogenase [Mycotypha africana]KAI8977365.1 iron hydrogenase [Mycotypha africana]
MQSKDELFKVLANNKEALKENRPQDYRTVVISISPQSRASFAAKYNLSPLQVHRKLVYFFKNHLGAHHVFDTAFTQDLSLAEASREFIDRFKHYMENGGDILEAAKQEVDKANDEDKPKVRTRRRAGAGARNDKNKELPNEYMPMLASSCSGWICYAEKTHGEVLPLITSAKSPQQMMGSLVKDYFAKKIGRLPHQIYHVCIMPCFDKKLEASRPDFYVEEYDTREVDCVLATIEIENLLKEQDLDFSTLPEAVIDDIINKIKVDPTTGEEVLYGIAGSSSGGALEYIFARAALELFNIADVPADPLTTESPRVIVKTGKNSDVKEYLLVNEEGKVVLRFATAYGFRNIQNIVRKVKSGKCVYHYVEVMACPGGCANGGGQLPPGDGETKIMNAKDWVVQVENIYRSPEGVKPEDNEVIKAIYSDWIGNPSGERAKRLLRTQYHAVTNNFANPLATKW